MRPTYSRDTWTPHSTGDLIAEGSLSIGDGYRAKNSELSTSGLPFARAGSIDWGFQFDEADRFPEQDLAKVGDKVSQPSDVVFTSKGTVGRLAFVRETTPRFVYAPQLCFWRSLAPDVIDARWLYYWMCGDEFTQQISGVKGQTDMADYVSLTDQRRMAITLPPTSIQRAIAGVLGALDDKIEQNRRTARTLERLARAIFRAWFVDFEPVKAKAAGATSFPSMPQTVFSALPTRFVDSEIGPVPEGWEVGGTSSIATRSKIQVNPQEHANEVFDHFSIPAFDADVRAVVEFGEAIKSNKFLVVEGCVLLSKLNPRIARIWLPPSHCGRRQIASTEFLVFVPRAAFDRHYLYCQFQQSSFREELAQSASGTSNSHQRVRPDDVLQKTVIVPPSPVRKGFADIADPLFALSAANHAESANLAEVRDLLLPQLLSGQVRVEVAHG